MMTAESGNRLPGYANDGVAKQVGIYNAALLPLTPFIFYDHKLVISRQWDLAHIAIPGFEKSPELFQWPMNYIQIMDEVIDPTTYGLQEKHRKMWLLSPQFGHNCVIQAGVPPRLYGKAIPNSVITIKFAGFEKTLTMGEDDEEWETSVPAMEASAEPKLLHVTCTLDRKLAHERKITNVVVGDVWYVGDIGKPFTFCGEIGHGHPDPDIGFADGRFYLINQTASD